MLVTVRVQRWGGGGVNIQLLEPEHPHSPFILMVDRLVFGGGFDLFVVLKDDKIEMYLLR